ncbi:MAG TPA: hypothetical protein VGD17_07485 [Chitinophagaceae bacterium]
MLASLGFLLIFILSLFFIYGRVKNKTIQLKPSQVTLAFGFKVMLGCLYGYIFQRFYGGDDTWMLHAGSIQEYQKLMRDPGRFFADFDITASFRRNDGFAAGWYFLLSDLEYWIITKPLAIFNMFSRGNYYINVVFFNLITFWGQYLIFKLFAAHFPKRRTLIFFLVFLIPSISFWLSGIRPDAWIMVALGFALYYFHTWLYSKRIKHLLLFMAGILGLIIFRSPVLLILLPGLLAWFITIRSSKPAWLVFTIVYVTCITLVFSSAYLSPKTNLLTYVVNRQQEFFRLKGNTVYELNVLQPEPASFLRTLPQAFVNSFVRPYPWEAKGPLQWMTAIDTMAVLLLIVISIVSKGNPEWIRSPLIWTALLFAIGLYLFIGYTVPFPGAIARYKVIPELLLLVGICLRPKTNRKKI